MNHFRSIFGPEGPGEKRDSHSAGLCIGGDGGSRTAVPLPQEGARPDSRHVFRRLALPQLLSSVQISVHGMFSQEIAQHRLD